jgi:hypothetical protein
MRSHTAINSPQSVGTPITNITLAAQDAGNQTVANFVGWTEASPGQDIVITPFDDFHGVGIDKVEVKIRRSLAEGGKLFTHFRVIAFP